jgi:hypothetical protein
MSAIIKVIDYCRAEAIKNYTKSCEDSDEVFPKDILDSASETLRKVSLNYQSLSEECMLAYLSLGSHCDILRISEGETIRLFAGIELLYLQAMQVYPNGTGHITEEYKKEFIYPCHIADPMRFERNKKSMDIIHAQLDNLLDRRDELTKLIPTLQKEFEALLL